MIGIVIPTHNNDQSLHAFLQSVGETFKHPGLEGEDVKAVVVLDQCTDESFSIALNFPFDIICVEADDHADASEIGEQHLVATGARWVAYTEPGEVLSTSWLFDQLTANNKAVWAANAIEDWAMDADDMEEEFETANTGKRPYSQNAAYGLA